MYRIVLTRSASKELHALPGEIVSRISKKIDILAENPRPSGSKKLKGTDDNLWRIRIGNYRVIYAIDDEIRVIDIIKIAHRKDVYE